MSAAFPGPPLSSPPATATPGQAAYEASVAVMAGDFEHPPWRWDQLPPKHRQGWDAAAQAAARPALAECARLIAELAACRQNNAAIAVQLGQYRDERDDARKAFAGLAGHFTRGAQSGLTARISGTVYRRLCVAAMYEPGDGGSEPDEDDALRSALYDIIRVTGDEAVIALASKALEARDG